MPVSPKAFYSMPEFVSCDRLSYVHASHSPVVTQRLCRGDGCNAGVLPRNYQLPTSRSANSAAPFPLESA